MCWLTLTLIPVLILATNDIRFRIIRNDMPNLVRQFIIVVAVSFVILKLILTVVRSNEMKAIFDGINEDYENYNDLPDEHQQIVEGTIKKTKILEKIWIIIMGTTALSYPVLASVCTIYSALFSENPRRFMVHEIKIIFLTEDQKYDSPFFEMIAAYSIFVVWVIFIGFTGYDGMFTVCIQHVSLKIKLLSFNLKYLFIDTNDVIKIKRNITEFVEGHCEIIRLVGEIQKCYEVWLAGMFFLSVVQIGMALSQVTADAESDINGMYYLFVACTIVYIYLPCYLASDVTYNAAEVANYAYGSSWETITDSGLRKSICIIIARAQIPIHFKALGMLTFNMEMFVSILQTAYSMYTLLRT
ncbi:odorant receptor 4-like [Melitaea cinxia]|uniref:odorant receptor 4-like n=1 Tax=Melitaea cinxia TaxID=113334 RepID=UPI001E272FD6|nr:odorant receptor 4-like [Melitaea cinxia]